MTIRLMKPSVAMDTDMRDAPGSVLATTFEMM
jgi:hypothetical protein